MSYESGPSPSQALSIAKAVFHSRYKGALFAFVAGSIMRGEGTRMSDIDLVVIYESVEAAKRQSFVEDGVPIEAFVHDASTLAWFVDSDIARGRPSILNMIAEGTVVGRELDRAEAIRQRVSERLLEGPPKLTSVELNALRYEITDAIDDLRGDHSSHELTAIGAMLYPKLAELALRGRNQWNGSGKWTARLLFAVDSALAARFEEAFRALFTLGTSDPVIALAEAELEPHGGPLFDGDCRSAPAAWRA